MRREVHGPKTAWIGPKIQRNNFAGHMGNSAAFDVQGRAMKNQKAATTPSGGTIFFAGSQEHTETTARGRGCPADLTFCEHQHVHALAQLP